MNMKCNVCNIDFERLASHVTRAHGYEWREYLIKFKYNNEIPKCECGCGEDAPFTRSQGWEFRKFIHGHAVKVRDPLSEEARQSIGQKNSENMKRYFAENRERARQHMEMMRKQITPEIEERRLEATREAYRNWPQEKRNEASKRAIDLLEQGKIGPQAPYKTEWKRNPFFDRDEYMHSSWESAFLDRCIASGLRVTKKHDVRIQYTDENGVDRTYIPDFVAPDERVIYEIKGYETENDGFKAAACQEWCNANDFRYTMIHD